MRLAKAMGKTVTAISTSPNKEAAAREIGADKWVLIHKRQKIQKDIKRKGGGRKKALMICLRSFVVSTNPESMKSAAMSLDLILNTVSANHQVRKASQELIMYNNVEKGCLFNVET